jgi:Raf kinase inhibitor-like YbhB/YbcL family protein
MTLHVTSTAFHEGERIPPEFTGDGADASPPVSWSGLPSGAKSLALACEDPDAPKGAFTHWVIFNIPPDSSGLGPNVSKESSLPDGAIQGINDMGRIGYIGPSPPPGKEHHYCFKLYALDTSLNLDAGAHMKDLRSALSGHVLAEGQLTGTYSR